MEIWRGGVSTRRIKKEDGYAYVTKGGAHDNDKRPGIYFSFPPPSKGGGTTQARLWVPVDDFKDIAEEMVGAAPEAARIAFLEVLLNQADPKRKRRDQLAARALRQAAKKQSSA
ncbi:MAG: hypothetical protein WC670_10650 [Pseudolabrys sp.]|jgi:hypothetical protein